ncbi:MAG: hypothetical protein ACT4PW_10535 [Acidimicrobiia bacterium]
MAEGDTQEPDRRPALEPGLAERTTTDLEAGPAESGPAVASALPSRRARALAFTAILVGGACGGLIGFAIADLQCVGSCSSARGFAGLVGAVAGAVGVAVVAVLALRAMGEWKTIQAGGRRRR